MSGQGRPCAGCRARPTTGPWPGATSRSLRICPTARSLQDAQAVSPRLCVACRPWPALWPCCGCRFGTPATSRQRQPTFTVRLDACVAPDLGGSRADSPAAGLAWPCLPALGLLRGGGPGSGHSRGAGTLRASRGLAMRLDALEPPHSGLLSGGGTVHSRGGGVPCRPCVGWPPGLCPGRRRLCALRRPWRADARPPMAAGLCLRGLQLGPPAGSGQGRPCAACARSPPFQPSLTPHRHFGITYIAVMVA